VSWSDKGRQLRKTLSRVNWYFYSGLVFLVSVLGAIGWGGTQLHALLNDADALPIEAIAVKGERTFTKDDEIQDALQDLMQRSFFSADVVEVQQVLESLPWVYKAKVRREWPAQFKVHLTEQVTVARWNDKAWLNVQGEVFEAPLISELAALPVLWGPETMAKEVLTSFKQLNDLLTINGFKLVSLSLSPRRAWRAQLDNGILLELGREDKMSRVQRFINVYPTLEKSSKPVAKVDLRYDTGFAVGWNETK
jgi:cell division protein FtsQ